MKKYNGKAIYSPSGKAAEYSYWACNFYKGCSGGCSYCYLKKGVLNKILGGNTPVLKSCFKDEYHTKEVFLKELIDNLTELRINGLFFSFTSDFLYETEDLLKWAIEMCIMKNVPVKVLTKQINWITNKWLYYLVGAESEIAFGFTLTGHDELEPGCASNKQRIKKMKTLKGLGFRTWASIEPIIDFQSSKEMIEQIVDFCDLLKVGLMSGKKYDVVEAQSFVEWLNELEKPKIYLKESLQKLSNYTNKELDSFFVERDYNIFEIIN